MTASPLTERQRRWRLLLGESEGAAQLSGADAAMDTALAFLYPPADQEKNRMKVGRGRSQPYLAQWLGDIRQYFPSTVVQVMQRDAYERLNLQQVLLEPELLRSLEPDVHLVSTLVNLRQMMPETVRDTARQVITQVVEDLQKRLAPALEQAVRGSLNRAAITRRPKRVQDIHWPRTIRANLKHYLPEYQSIVPQQLFGHPSQQASLRDIVLCVDQSGSMASSVVYASLFAAVLASLRAVSTSLVVYDTAVVDLTAALADPVEVLFGTQLGGGNDTPRALAYCETLIRRPEDTILVLISDLYEGAGSAEMIRRIGKLVQQGVQVIGLLALDDQGRPSFDGQNASALASLGVPTFACTPDQFPELMAAAINRQDVAQWASGRGIAVSQRVG